jgi:nicotinate-nucleotide adenylyltransferase
MVYALDPRTKRLGIMGGTFDPIHNGHLVAASEVAHRFNLDQVLFVPTGQPWQKEQHQVTAAEHRYLMTVIATAADARFEVSRVDIERPGPTFTVDTLKDLRQQFGAELELFFITGADALSKILTWRDHEEVVKMAHLVGVTRPGHNLQNPGLPQDAITLIEIPALAISSTDVRARVARSEPIRYIVPDGVAFYIKKHSLYLDADPNPDPELVGIL